MKGWVIKIRKGKEQKWIDWCKELQNSRRNEVIETLVEENLLQEFSAIFKLNGESYIVGMMDGDFVKGDPDRDINIKHRQIKDECFDRNNKIAIETLYHLKVK